ncbi:unannotated protein [freshwater metagenome]|uniref:Unannotated protein n=1 Tax=freshwater metagenome TaxID=449393 RepID=A0A6J7EYV1_9ZZZZ|nr:hypothetical protein [Actinomycetota bacterium]
MLFWFLGTAVASVWFVFRDPGFDYRLLCVGALLPDVIDPWFGGARAMHSVTISIAALLLVVIASAGRKRWRKRALAVPIGIMLHLVYDGAFSNTVLFWWPVGGLHFRDDPLPSMARGWVDVPLELIGLALLVWVWRTFGLRSRVRRDLLWRTGRLELTVTANSDTGNTAARRRG